MGGAVRNPASRIAGAPDQLLNLLLFIVVLPFPARGFVPVRPTAREGPAHWLLPSGFFGHLPMLACERRSIFGGLIERFTERVTVIEGLLAARKFGGLRWGGEAL